MYKSPFDAQALLGFPKSPLKVPFLSPVAPRPNGEIPVQSAKKSIWDEDLDLEAFPAEAITAPVPTVPPTAPEIEVVNTHPSQAYLPTLRGGNQLPTNILGLEKISIPTERRAEGASDTRIMRWQREIHTIVSPDGVLVPVKPEPIGETTISDGDAVTVDLTNPKTPTQQVLARCVQRQIASREMKDPSTVIGASEHTEDVVARATEGSITDSQKAFIANSREEVNINGRVVVASAPIIYSKGPHPTFLSPLPESTRSNPVPPTPGTVPASPVLPASHRVSSVSRKRF